VLDACRDPYIEVDREGRLTEWSRPTEALLGWRRDEMLGQPIDRVVSSRFVEVLHQGLDVLRGETHDGSRSAPSTVIEPELVHRDDRTVMASSAIFTTGAAEDFGVGAFIHAAVRDPAGAHVGPGPPARHPHRPVEPGPVHPGPGRGARRDERQWWITWPWPWST
jgi:PAS domain-containing protein